MTGDLKKWLDEDWVRINSSGKIAGKCGTSKNKKNPDRCLPRSKANSLTQSQRAATARKKKQGGSQGKQFVSNTKSAKVMKAAEGGPVLKLNKGCGAVLSNKRKKTRYA